MTSKPIHSIPTKDLYARWAKVYDSDGNILREPSYIPQLFPSLLRPTTESIDDHFLPSLLTQAFSLVPSSSSSPITITELGAGTGRNTVKLLQPREGFKIENVNALDLSPEMLALAKSRCSFLPSTSTSAPSPKVDFYEFDAFQPSSFPDVQALEGKAGLVLSTLVLEHLRLKIFFETAKRLLKANGVLVMTNMHADMGRLSRAGFIDTDTVGECGDSFVYEIKKVVEAGREEGFEVIGKMLQRGIGEGDVGVTVGERGVKWVGVSVWFGCVMRLEGKEE
ncbi:putative methyltransferase [Lachnellula arida]|uniref:Putative methyltransferase n=1 Tax=Lachnellula arida TaxID=1316785 RepID=A0A8T9BNH2_9HELO|nr:putative methyltransferase [Lachnellula arida]